MKLKNLYSKFYYYSIRSKIKKKAKNLICNDEIHPTLIKKITTYQKIK